MAQERERSGTGPLTLVLVLGGVIALGPLTTAPYLPALSERMWRT